MKNVFVLLLLTVTLGMQAQTWTNPLTLANEWPGYGIGDPYIMKYRGTYYLYCSTADNNIGVKCWSTKDFITWSGAYTCSTDPITKTAYAPEVVYWNGTFYMYTSPNGGGHYILSSDSPTGPFTRITSNLGKEIDGSVFIEDNGTWSFYHASNDGIIGCPMSNPTTIGGGSNLTGRMGYGWTEGPCVIKRNGTYYLLYTGNHVLSKGYRIDYAKNTGGSLSSFSQQSAQNPVLINSEGAVVGLGHGSAFIGPDLDTYYFTYHNLENRVPFRHLNFERIAWNGDKLLMLGPTTWPQQGFQQADIADFFDRNEIGDNWLTPGGGHWTIQDQDRLVQDLSNNETAVLYKALYNQATGSNYTAEFTLREKQRDSEAARFGAVFGYSDEANYGIAVLQSYSNRLEINFKENNTWGTPHYYSLPTAYNLNVWHHLRIEKSGTAYKFFVDGMQKAALTNALGAGKIGYMTNCSQADFGYIAFSNKTNGSGIFDTSKPIPGTIAAVHYNTGGEGVGYHDLTEGNSGGKYIRNDNVDTGNCSDGGFAIIDNQSGEWYKYNVNVKSSGVYNLGLRYSSAVETGKIRIWQGDTDLTGAVSLPSTKNATAWHTFTIKDLVLEAGFQTLKIETVSGDFNVYEMQFAEAANAAVTLTDSFDTAFGSGWNYVDGAWNIESGEANINGYGKRTFGETGWTDYTIQTDVTYYNAFNAGLIFRVNNPALGGAGDSPDLGTDYLQGYFVTLSDNSVVLGKQNYSWTLLSNPSSGPYVTNKKYTLKVVVKGANIKVYVDNMETPKIDYTDPRPFISGKVGFRACNAHAHFDNFSITTANDGNPAQINRPAGQGSVELFPNPVSDELTVRNIADYSRLSIYKVDGREIYSRELSEPECLINTSGFDKGWYILKLSSEAGAYVTRKIIRN
jgi:hypothetical protein